MNTANKITVFRVLLVPILIWFLLDNSIQNRFLFALFVFIVASITDHLDGKLARKYNESTNFGKFLDPLADKMLVMSSFICFIEINLVSAIPVLIILFRDLLVTSIRLVAASAGKVVAANIFGKIKTAIQMLSITMILLLQCLIENKMYSFYNVKNVNLINNVLVWLVAILTIWSGYVYLKENIDFIKISK